jgi:phosphomannomutase
MHRSRETAAPVRAQPRAVPPRRRWRCQNAAARFGNDGHARGRRERRPGRQRARSQQQWRDEPERWHGLSKSYDVRDTVPDRLDAGAAHAIGLGLANYLEAGPVAVRRDMRHSSPMLAAALIQGLTAGGLEVWDLGLCSTDLVTFATGRYGLAGGVMVTASHNPPAWNGFKCCARGGFPLSGQHGLNQIQDRILAGDLPRAAAPGRVVARDLVVDYPHWWFNVRLSNTEPLLCLNVEADYPALQAEKRAELLALLRAC